MCIFCKIVKDEIPSYKIYEDEEFLAFLDISQASVGHALVVTKKHYDNVLEMEEAAAGRLFALTVRLAKQIKKNLDVSGMNILNNCGESAGQSVMHAHVHIIPRYENDSVTFRFTKNQLSDSELQTLAERIKRN
ncbi:MAG TPA: HIT family protein [Acholeplasmatales bacterium]|nr:HIT family protein [Acholeplasmatales bacterium]